MAPRGAVAEDMCTLRYRNCGEHKAWHFKCPHYASVRSDFTQLFTGLPSQNLIYVFGQKISGR